MFSGSGRAKLDFGNCFFLEGTVYAYLDGNEIASASKETPSVTVEFDFNVGSILMITEAIGIIQFNSLDIIHCNVGKIVQYFFNASFFQPVFVMLFFILQKNYVLTIVQVNLEEPVTQLVENVIAKTTFMALTVPSQYPQMLSVNQILIAQRINIVILVVAVQ